MSPTPGAGPPIRLLLIAPHPVRLDDLDVGDLVTIERAVLVRRSKGIAAAIDDLNPNVVVVDTAHREDGGVSTIGDVLERAPDVGVLALTPDPPGYEQVGGAVKAGARGFVDVSSEPTELADAMRTVRDGGLWLPPSAVRPILDDVGGLVERTSADRRSRLTGILIGLVPLTGVLAAILAFVWRRYAGQIGVRPVDIAVDPASRIVDAITSLLLVLGAFGPLLLISTWVAMLSASRLSRGPVAWLLSRRVLAFAVLAAAWLALAYIISLGPDLLLMLAVGPLMAVAVIARATDVSHELPPALRISASPKAVLLAGVAALLVFLGGVAAETFAIGPELSPRGEGGVIVPRIIGFNAQPVDAVNVDTGEERQLLYLGGNADLYVLVDPCDDNSVEFVSVGSHRLEVIDEVICSAPDGS